MSAGRKVAKGVRCNWVQNPCSFLIFLLEGHGGTAGDDLPEMPSTLTNGLEVPEMFQKKCFMSVAFFEFVRGNLSVSSVGQ